MPYKKNVITYFIISVLLIGLAVVSQIFMAENVLIISGSPRKNGNSEMLCDAFAAGAAAAGKNVEKISLAGRFFIYCTTIT